MDQKRLVRITLGTFIAVMALLTVLYVFDIKFVVGVNIIVWDVLAAAVWIFLRMCRWAGRKNTGRRSLGIACIAVLGLFGAAILFMGLCIYGTFPQYMEQTEPQTGRTFAVEYTSNMMGKGTAKLYERYGPLLFPCKEEEYVGDISPEPPGERKIYIDEDGKEVVVAYFFLWPIFFVPIE